MQLINLHIFYGNWIEVHWFINVCYYVKQYAFQQNMSNWWRQSKVGLTNENTTTCKWTDNNAMILDS